MSFVLEWTSFDFFVPSFVLFRNSPLHKKKKNQRDPPMITTIRHPETLAAVFGLWRDCPDESTPFLGLNDCHADGM
jgi:hypothetical protein